MVKSKSRAGSVALIGEPNTGKSTLMNQIVGSKVSIVTHKAQTTRSRIRGIAIRDNTQIVFVDTPGLFNPRNRLDKGMVSSAWRSLEESDIILLMVMAPRGLNNTFKSILERLAGAEPPLKVALVINKIDLVPRNSLLEKIATFSNLHDFERVFMISAANGDGVDDIVDWLASVMPVAKWMYPSNQIADASLQSMAAEITREKLLLRVHQEIPYQANVETERWLVRKDGSVRIDQSIIVSAKSHKHIVVGPKGSVIRQIGIDARKDIQTLTKCQIHLFLQVKIRPDWANAPISHDLGLSSHINVEKKKL